MSREETLLEIFLEEKEQNEKQKYTLIINKNAENKELMILKSSSLEGAKKYYPDKNFETLVNEESLKSVLKKIKELSLTDYDVIFIDKLDFENFFVTKKYINNYTEVRSIIIDSALRNLEGSKTKKITDKIKEEIDSESESYDLKVLDELLLGKNIEEIKNYSKEKNISLKTA